MNVRKNQTGFSLVEGLLVIIALAIVGGVGYYVYHTQQETNKTAESAKTSTTPPVSSTSKKDYLVFKEAGVKVDKSAIPGARYTVGKNQGPAVDIAGFPEVMTFNLYDSAYDSTTNNKGVRCDSSRGEGDELATVQIVQESVRDAKYAQYKNKDIAFDEAVPAVLSDKYATKSNSYLYVYSRVQGVQGLPGCASDENDQKVLDQLKQSQEGFGKMLGTLSKQ
jgi:hypothetical protein